MEAWGLACANALRLEISRLLEAAGLEGDVRGPVSGSSFIQFTQHCSGTDLPPILIPQGCCPGTSKKNNIPQAPPLCSSSLHNDEEAGFIRECG